MDIEKSKREHLRWQILVAANASRPVPLNEQLLLSVLQDVPLHVTALELRRELDYLEDRSLIDLMGVHGPVWSAVITRYGVDVVEYTVDVEPGISRPKKYW